jgi:hypothetical protein
MKAPRSLLPCLVWFGAASALFAAEAQKVLLLDATLIERSDNIRIAIGRPEKSAHNPLFGEDRPWEPRFDNMYPNVVWDEQARLFKCWYSPFLVEVEDWIGSTPNRKRWLYPRESGLCYAESVDGIHWKKPAFDILPFRGQSSNILVRDIHGVGVFLDRHETDPNRRYKMTFVNQDQGRYAGLGVASSPDGIHWSPQTPLTQVKVKGDTHNNALWAPTLNRYVAFTRDWDPRDWKRDSNGNIPAVRLVARIESEDFEHWSDSQVVLRGLDDQHQIYEMPVFYYGGVYLGLPVVYDSHDDRAHPELAWSKDTVNWHRIEPGTPLIPCGEKGAYDWGCVYPAAYPLAGPDGIKLFYAGSDGLHFGERKSYFALATLRADGFAAATPADSGQPGSIVTTLRTFDEGTQLRLTADTENAGSVQVTVLDVHDREIARSEPLTGSFTSRPVVWQGGMVHPLHGSLRLKFTLLHTKLYSYDFVPAAAGK